MSAKYTKLIFENTFKSENTLPFFIDSIDFCRIDISHPIFKAYDTKCELVLSISAGMPKIEAPQENRTEPIEYKIDYIRLYQDQSGELYDFKEDGTIAKR